MPLLTGPASLSRYNVLSAPDEPPFDDAAFREIAPGSELRESSGFLPMEPGAPYLAGARRLAFRVRTDTLRPDPTAVKERLKGLLKAELEATGAQTAGPKKRRQLRQLAEEELIVSAVPRSQIVEGAIDGDLLYLATTAKNALGAILALLRRVGVVAEPKAPWIDGDEEDLESDVVPLRQPGESLLGCRFLRALIEDRELTIEPENGLVRLRTAEARVTLGGGVRGELHRLVERGAEILSAKLVAASTSFRLDGLSFRIDGLRLETGRHEHWTEALDERLERIAAVFEMLDAKYAELSPRLRGAAPPRKAAARATAPAGPAPAGKPGLRIVGSP